MRQSLESRCRANVERWLQAMEAPVPARIIETPPLAPQPDRCFLEGCATLSMHLAVRMDRWDLLIASHRPLGVPTAVRGWRERRARWAAQLILHQHPDYGEFHEIDFDASNPNWGLTLVISHGLFDWAWQKLRGHSTNPWTVAKKRGWEAALNA